MSMFVAQFYMCSRRRRNCSESEHEVCARKLKPLQDYHSCPSVQPAVDQLSIKYLFVRTYIAYLDHAIMVSDASCRAHNNRQCVIGLDERYNPHAIYFSGDGCPFIYVMKV